jgi:hypothetical protein
MATFDYTSRDFLSIRQDLLARAEKTIPEWNGTDSSEFANVFVDLWAYMGDILHFYVDRAAGETFLETATQRESIQAIANLLDYIPASARAARGQVTVKLNSLPSGATSYTVPQYTTFKGYDADRNEYNFYLANDSLALDLTTTNQSTGAVVQGSLIFNELIGVSAGFTNQKFSLLKTNVDVESITISVYEGPLVSGVPSAVEYTYVPQMSSAHYSDKVFTARSTSSGYTQIIFGNGFNGTVPTTNASITASYRTTDGSNGNIPANGIKFVTSSPQSTYISVVSSGAFSGGANPESIDSIKTNVARLYRTQDRAVSLQDYKDLTLQVPSVSKATAVYSAPNVTLYPVPYQSSYPPEPITSGTTKVIIEIPLNITESIELYFSTRSMLGVTASVVNPANHGSVDRYIECTPIYVGIQVYVKTNYVQSYVQAGVDKAIRDLLSFDKVSFGQIVTVGEVYRAALSVIGVDYVILTNLSTTYDSTPATVSTVANVAVSATQLPCFTDKISSRVAVNFDMVGGLTGSN